MEDPRGWDIAKLREILSSPLVQEDGSFELKEMIPTDDSGKYRLKKEFCGYANKSGGLIFFGIKNDKTIVGLQSTETEFSTRISQIITSNIYPPTIRWAPYVCIPLEDPSKSVYVVKVFESVFSQKPHSLYSQEKGLCIPLREAGHLRDITNGAEIRKIFLNSEGYYPEYNIHILEILKHIKGQSAPKFTFNEVLIFQAYKSFLRSQATDQLAHIADSIEQIERQVAEMNRVLLNSAAEGAVISTNTQYQILEKMVDDYIAEFGSQII